MRKAAFISQNAKNWLFKYCGYVSFWVYFGWPLVFGGFVRHNKRFFFFFLVMFFFFLKTLVMLELQIFDKLTM